MNGHSPPRVTSEGRTHSSASLCSEGSVLRFDEMTGIWVVFAAGRSNRPKQTRSSDLNLLLRDLPDIFPSCPFCEGNEHMTPETLFTRNDMRVVFNKYPAVDPMETAFEEDEAPPRIHRRASYLDNGLPTIYNETPAVGFHEVVIESSRHNVHMATAPVSHTHDLLTCFRERGRAHAQHEGVEHTVYFKNHGATAGASLIHPHAQIVSTPVVPVEAKRLQSLAFKFFEKSSVSLYERIIEEEMALYDNNLPDSRIVDVSPHFLSMVPYASPGPYVITILPRYGPERFTESHNHVDCSDFTSTSDELLEECADILQKALLRLQLLLHEPCFNLVVQSAPVRDRGVQAAFRACAYFRWHIRITPRLGAGAMAGFELGSGFFSNSHMPELDAAELRAVDIDITTTTTTEDGAEDTGIEEK